jgi:8-oxo-dGTP diphosphatase
LSRNNKTLFYEEKINPAHASAALIFYRNKLLLQKRDNKKNIFYPNFYGLFGGGKEKNESYAQCIQREINEELNIKISKKKFKFFCRNMLDFTPLKKNKVYRNYYYVFLGDKDFRKIKLNEGKNMKLFNLYDLLISNDRIVPYDAFVLWLFAHKQKNYK